MLTVQTDPEEPVFQIIIRSTSIIPDPAEEALQAAAQDRITGIITPEEEIIQPQASQQVIPL
jgi:hypothetical protein